MKRAKYKVGDKVRVNTVDELNRFNGLVGTVIHFYESTQEYLVCVEDDQRIWCKESELELLEPIQPIVSDDFVKPDWFKPKKGKQSHLDARYDLIPPTALKTVAEVLGEGEAKYPAIDGVPNWHYITTNDHLNHALAHIYAYLSGVDTGEDDLSHAATRMLLALEIDRIGVKEK